MTTATDTTRRTSEAQRALTADEMRRLLTLIDQTGPGHAIVEPVGFAKEANIPAEALGITTTFASSTTDPKGAIFGNDGSIKPAATGVYLLDLLRDLARARGVTYRDDFYGRGSQGREIVRALRESLPTT